MRLLPAPLAHAAPGHEKHPGTTPASAQTNPAAPSGVSWRRRTLAVSVLFAASVAIGWMVVNKTAPANANADMILYSIMSLQNVTLFYWGQGRLLNVTAFLFQAVRDPSTNLVLILTAHAASFFGMMLLAAYFVGRLVPADNAWGASVSIGAAAAATFAVLLSEVTVHSVIVGQGQYPLSYLAVLIAHAALFHCHAFRWAGVLAFLMLMSVGIGLNPSAIVFVAGGYLALALLQPTLRRRALFAVAATLLIFIAWWGAGEATPGGQIFVAPDDLAVWERILTAFQHLYSGLRFGPAALIVLLLACAVLMWFGTAKVRALTVISVLLCLAFVSAFAQHPWVGANKYDLRYFEVVYFVAALLVGLAVYIVASKLGPFVPWAVTLAAATVILGAFWSAPAAPASYKIIARNDQHAGKPVSFHAGDYWYAWPAVFADLARGGRAYGFSFRSQGNRLKLERAARKALKGGSLTVLCHKASVGECTSQVALYFPELAAPRSCSPRSPDAVAVVYSPAPSTAAGSIPGAGSCPP